MQIGTTVIIQIQKKYTKHHIIKLKNKTSKEHKRIFHVVCNIETLNMSAEGSGSSRRDAEQEAAAEILLKIGEH